MSHTPQRKAAKRPVKPHTLDRRAEKIASAASAKKSIEQSVSRPSGKFKNIAKFDKRTAAGSGSEPVDCPGGMVTEVAAR